MQETFKVASYDVTWLCGPLCGMRLPAAAIYFCFCFSIFPPTVSTVTLRKNIRRKCFRPKSRSIREFTREMPQTKIGMHSLCESEHSKCTWACHKSHFRREFSGKNAGAKIGTHSLCLRRRNAHGHVINAISGENLQEKCWDQDRDAQFVLEQSKRTKRRHKSHFTSEFAGKVRGPRSGRTVCASLRSSPNADGHATIAAQ